MVEYKSRIERRKAKQQRDEKPGKKQSPKKKRGFFKRLIVILLLLFLFLVLAGAITVFAIVKNAPALNPNMLRDPVSTTIMDNHGKAATTVFSNQKRIYANIDTIPLNVQNAFISTEDTRFYKHFGIDPIRIAGAAVAQFTRGYKSEGASTITQQVVRNSFLTQKKLFTRKIQEAYLAIKLEQKYTKKQILEMYLNKIYLGEGSTYGVATASEVYYGKSINHVSLAQAAMLAAMTRNPGYYDPLVHPEHAKERRDLVLDLMVNNHAITKEQAEQAKQVSMKEMTKGHHKLKTTKTKYSAFINYVHNELVNQKKLLTDAEFYNGGLKIYTTLNTAIQQRVENVLNNDSNYPNVQNNFQAGVSVIDTQTGAIRAIGGGRHYKDSTNWNYGTSADGNVGSSAKPIMDYGPAIEYMKWPTNKEVVDEPWHYSTGQSFGDWDGKYKGTMTMRQALAQSRNVPAVKTLQTVLSSAGQSTEKSFTKKLGFNFDDIKESYGIGAFASSPLKMAGAYAAFGNEGVYNQPYAVKKIDFPDGSVTELDHKQYTAMHDYTAYMISDMLKDVVSSPAGTGRTADIPGVPLAGKTGTQNIPDDYAKQYGISSYDQSHGALDAWFVGYTTKLTASVWTGYTKKEKSGDGTFLGQNEQHYSQAIFRNIMSNFVGGSTDFKQPSSVVDIGNGELAVRNTAAAQISNQDKEKQGDKTKKVDAPTGLSASYDQASKSVQLSWNYSGSATFKVSNGSTSVGTTGSTSLTVPGVTPGKTYTFTVTAETADGKSSAASVSIKIPADTSDQNNNQGNNQNTNNNGDQTNQNGTGNQQNNGGSTNPNSGTTEGNKNNQGKNSGNTDSSKPSSGGGNSGGSNPTNGSPATENGSGNSSGDNSTKTGNDTKTTGQ